jgi:hypothetical protein
MWHPTTCGDASSADILKYGTVVGSWKPEDGLFLSWLEQQRMLGNLIGPTVVPSLTNVLDQLPVPPPGTPLFKEQLIEKLMRISGALRAGVTLRATRILQTLEWNAKAWVHVRTKAEEEFHEVVHEYQCTQAPPGWTLESAALERLLDGLARKGLVPS